MLSALPFLSFYSPSSKEFLPQSPWTPTANYLKFALSCITMDFLMKLWPSVNKEKLKDGVRTANKSTCISKLRLSLSSEVKSSDQVKFSSTCPMYSQQVLWEDFPHITTLHVPAQKRRKKTLLTLGSVLFVYQADADSLEQRETAAKVCLKWKWQT